MPLLEKVIELKWGYFYEVTLWNANYAQCNRIGWKRCARTEKRFITNIKESCSVGENLVKA